MLRDYDYEWRVGLDTPLFEIVYPENRIVVDYEGRRQLCLLAVLNNETCAESAMAWNGWVVTHHDSDDLGSFLTAERSNAEGYVVTFRSGLRVKIKHTEYVRLHKIVTGVNARHIWDALKNGQDPQAELDGVPDEVFAWIDSTVADLKVAFAAQLGTAQNIFQRRPTTDDRREIAEYFKGSGGDTGVLFKMLDEKPYYDLIWKAIKPEPLTPDTVWNQEVAA